MPILTNSDFSSFDFGSNKDGNDWFIINDGVMGGLSKGQVTFTDNTLTFTGSVSLENNGGFTSFKSPYSRYDLSQFTTVSIRYRLSGQTISINLENNRAFYLPNYKYFLPPTKQEWTSIDIPLSDFAKHIMGKPTGDSISAKTLSKIIRIGFITADKQASNFVFEVDYLRFK